MGDRPGKIKLLELINACGSIAVIGPGRRMNMSYRRAWLLVDDLNRLF
jgi:molybdate transport system regulatory protein